MERLDLPFSEVLEQEIQEWKKFQSALRKEDQQFLDRLFEKARLHVQEIRGTLLNSFTYFPFKKSHPPSPLKPCPCPSSVSKAH
jgi:hypothetical protein